MADTLNHLIRRSMTLLNAGGMQLSDTLLQEFCQSGYQSAARQLRAAGMGLLRKQSSAIEIAVGVTEIGRTGTAVYPSDMLRPIELRERVKSTTAWTAMKSSDGFLPTDNTDATLKVWDWRGDIIVVPGHVTSTIEVQIQYEAELSLLTYPESTMMIPDGLDAVSRLSAALAATSLGNGGLATAWREEATEMLKLIAEAEVRVKRAAAARWGRQ